VTIITLSINEGGIITAF